MKNEIASRKMKVWKAVITILCLTWGLNIWIAGPPGIPVLEVKNSPCLV